MWLKCDSKCDSNFRPFYLNWISVQRINKVEKGVLCILCSLFCEKWLLSLSSSFCFNGVVCKAATIFFFILLLKYIWAQNSFLQEQSHPKCSFVHLLLLLASALHTKHYTQWLKIHHKKSHSTKKSKLKLQRWRLWRFILAILEIVAICAIFGYFGDCGDLGDFWLFWRILR